ncbi:type I-C CRISPR-associated endonuclease Cas1c [Psychrobacter sanguinis]|uniref:type I-C CRISPR-associated endonuclease Cas1c n=1 Tax=Psychrobacter sanguinis TaxID=861445 RepID=UPI001917A56E|nr:type I-C CRISPR-associated endonuclease Cas1c [Psychrobacter sanguinis]MCC3308291.1 type I-C CRISPR-associated endonuclease Cas1c [Psychrobacter sanguinis]
MRPLKNTLFVQTQGAWLNKQGENVVMNIDHEVKGRVPIHKLDAIVCFGQVSLSPALMAHCTDNGITITHLNQYGKFQARIEGAVSGNVLLRREQYRICDDVERVQPICHSIVLGKVHNQRQVVRRYLRDYKSELDDATVAKLEGTQKRLKNGLGSILATQNLPDLLGREGEMASYYFSVFPYLIRNPEFEFNKRTRNPPTDAVNALLSFTYTLMTHECRSALETVGLDPACGFFHQLRPGRPSLALDLVEEFRPMVDRFVLSLINKKQLSKKDFKQEPNGAVWLKDDARHTFFKAWHDRKQQTLKHDWFEETVPFGLLPHLQATIMARHIRGDIEAYVPFLWQ